MQVVLEVLEPENGGFVAGGLGECIFTQSETAGEIRNNVREAVACHFGSPPVLTRPIFVHEETLAAGSCVETDGSALVSKLWILGYQNLKVV